MNKLFLIPLLAALHFTVPVFSNTVDELLMKAETARKAHDYKQAISFYEQALEIDPVNFSALWNVSYLYQKVGWLELAESKKQFFANAARYAQTAYAQYPATYQANMVMAASIARLAEFMSAKERVHAAWDIKKYAEAAFSMNRTDPDVWYLLGWWNFELSKATWLERSLSKMLFGGLPGGASFDKAIECLEKANQLKPGNIIYIYDLATFYQKIGDKVKAIALCLEILGLKPLSADEKVYAEKGRSLLAKLG